jgi:hypothetical protein
MQKKQKQKMQKQTIQMHTDELQRLAKKQINTPM